MIGRLHRNWPFIASIAASDASNVSNATKPKPRELPVSPSRMIFGVDVTTPNAANVSYSSFSSTSVSRLPTKMFAPTSSVSLSRDACERRRGGASWPRPASPHLGAAAAAHLVHADGLAVHLDHVEHLDRVLRVLLPLELDEAKAHVLLRQLVLRDVHVDDRPTLHAQLPEQRLVDLLVEVAHVARRLLVAVEAPDVGHGSRRCV